MAPVNYAIDAKHIGIPMGQVFNYIHLRKQGMHPQEVPLAEHAYEYILKKVVFPEDGVSDAIKYGGKITETIIAEALGISNGPVREAIFRLRQEGWIKTIGSKGSFLVDFSEPDIAKGIYKFRLNFETGAFYTLASSATPEQIASLKKIVDAIESAKKQSDILAFRKADIDFHLAVVEFAGGEEFKQVFRSKLLQWYAMSFRILMKSFGIAKYRQHLENPGTSSHYELFDAIASKNSSQAAKLIAEHYSYVVHLLEIDKNA